jgi:hypothetical protein
MQSVRREEAAVSTPTLYNMCATFCATNVIHCSLMLPGTSQDSAFVASVFALSFLILAAQAALPCYN